MRLAISISATHNSMCVFSLFWPKKVQFKAKIYIFLNLYVNQLFSVGATMYKNINFVYLCICFAHKSMKTNPSKVGHFNKIAEIISTANRPKTSPNLKFCLIKK